MCIFFCDMRKQNFFLNKNMRKIKISLTDAERLLVGRWYRTFFRYTVYMTPSPFSSPHKRHVGCKNKRSNIELCREQFVPVDVADANGTDNEEAAHGGMICAPYFTNRATSHLLPRINRRNLAIEWDNLYNLQLEKTEMFRNPFLMIVNLLVVSSNWDRFFFSYSTMKGQLLLPLFGNN